MSTLDTFFVEIRLRDGEHFPFYCQGESYQAVEKRAQAACERQGATLLCVFNCDVWAICHLQPQEHPFNH
jgi:hypothetical protein